VIFTRIHVHSLTKFSEFLEYSLVHPYSITLSVRVHVLATWIHGHFIVYTEYDVTFWSFEY
jgi:hypothetical protein